jgi:hypothetical protein
MIEGNPGHRPINLGGPHDQRPLGPPPKHWPLETKAVWDEVAAALMPGIAAKADRIVFEAFVRLVIKVRTVSDLTPALAAQLRCYASEFAMTPAARARLSLGGTPAPSKFDGLIGPRLR